MKSLASQIAERTRHAYAADRYIDWTECAQVLLDYGLTQREAEAVLCSKWMRWIADDYGQDEVPADAVVEALANPCPLLICKRETIWEAIRSIVDYEDHLIRKGAA